MELIELAIGDVAEKEPIRADLGDLSTLENSIQRLGLLSPIIVDNQDVILAGRRRLQACRNLGMTTIAALRFDADSGSMKAAEIQSDENLCRLPLSPGELEKTIGLKKSLHRSNENLLSRVGSFFKGLVGKQ